MRQSRQAQGRAVAPASDQRTAARWDTGLHQKRLPAVRLCAMTRRHVPRGSAPVVSSMPAAVAGRSCESCTPRVRPASSRSRCGMSGRTVGLFSTRERATVGWLEEQLLRAAGELGQPDLEPRRWLRMAPQDSTDPPLGHAELCGDPAVRQPWPRTMPRAGGACRTADMAITSSIQCSGCPPPGPHEVVGVGL